MHVVYQTRFSYFGQSDWRSPTSADQEKLLDPQRLEARLDLFEALTLPSLIAQTDGDFTHVILASVHMPRSYQRYLNDMVGDVLGERAKVIFAPEGPAGQLLRSTTEKLVGDQIVAQIQLDDDDALASDFTELVRAHGTAALADLTNSEPYTYLSFPRGFEIGMDGAQPQWLDRCFAPYIPVGLTVIGPGTIKRNPLFTSARKIGERHPVVMVSNLRPYYLRGVHGLMETLDERESPGPSTRLRADQFAAAMSYFPFLAPHFAPKEDAPEPAAA